MNTDAMIGLQAGVAEWQQAVCQIAATMTKFTQMWSREAYNGRTHRRHDRANPTRGQLIRAEYHRRRR